MCPGVDALLEQARAGLRRLTPHETVEAVRGGALLIDTRTEAQRREEGELPGAIVIDRTVLEWRLDPASASAPFVATLVDVSGLVIYFSVALVILSGTLL